MIAREHDDGDPRVAQFGKRLRSRLARDVGDRDEPDEFEPRDTRIVEVVTSRCRAFCNGEHPQALAREPIDVSGEARASSFIEFETLIVDPPGIATGQDDLRCTFHGQKGTFARAAEDGVVAARR
jgi:hypothetical protein